MEKLKEYKIFFLIGAPGSGIQTQSSKLAIKYHLIHLDVGDLLLKEVVKNTPRGIAIRKLMMAQLPVPTDTVLSILTDAMLDEFHMSKNFLITGLPRELTQAKEFEDKVGCPAKVLRINCNVHTIMNRLVLRAQLNTSFCSEEAVIKRRLRNYFSNIDDIAGHYMKNHVLYEVNGEQPSEDVFRECCKVLDKSLTHWKWIQESEETKTPEDQSFKISNAQVIIENFELPN
ncbi:adenylate kinase isoenzyme 1-like [Protopterus annectens]|uniref:adenylate kinase isoenzyme 1-like n=1 Tax=Protopterus annectens TaxID=7888 RepID=UPI001CF9EB59|nr:adenylate kinase isoenzyme 1-like [Protopterus annectens]